METTLTVKEVAEILGVSENTVFKQWAKCKDKAQVLGIIKEGRGKKATYIQQVSDDKNKIAFEVLREFLIHECNFNTRTDFNKLIHYLYLVLLNTVDKSYYYSNLGYMYNIGIAEKNLIHYRKKLTEAKIMKSKKASKGVYAYLDTEGNYNICDVNLYDNFNKCIISECEKLLSASYTVDLTKANDYKKAKDIITSDFDIEELQSNLLNLSIKLQKEITKDTVMSLSFKDDIDLSRFYKIAFYEVSKAWQKEFNIQHIKFFPNHMLSDFIIRDIDFIELIVNAYNYIKND